MLPSKGLRARKMHLALGPFLALGGMVALLAGSGAVDFGDVLSKVLLPAVLSPISRGCRPHRDLPRATASPRADGDGTVKKGAKAGQILSASMVALAHGTNDAQKRWASSR